ncbi:peptide chain release factor N(5)-glutamine methyltransferase [Desulfovibrio inopinatus]|uniref:peptide chain release factor N(5)-glutamine methyltransferase n=1 Tax=Desulfovibrio inopinatus TaxID=102109 RepID=UPI000413F81B|nr:peptide chain release factor N(5)-glutamine methyltransferase [Desulfovibrio inopinatus]
MQERNTVRSILAKTTTYLEQKGVDSPKLSAQLLLAKILGVERLDLFLDPQRPIIEAELNTLRPLVARRGKGEPVAYLLGEREFYGRPFSVSSSVLVPRPETEHLIEEALKRIPAETGCRFIDLGTGSGILAVTAALEYPNATGLAVDICPDALAQARMNAQQYGVDGRISFQEADFVDLKTEYGNFDIVFSNPPYIGEADYQTLSHEVTAFEPRKALIGGINGVELPLRVIDEAEKLLKPGGWLFLEMGMDQGKTISDYLTEQTTFDSIEIVRDLAGLDRVGVARKKN